MLQGRDEFLIHNLELTDALLLALEEREDIEPDIMLAREAAEVLREELRSLQ